MRIEKLSLSRAILLILVLFQALGFLLFAAMELFKVAVLLGLGLLALGILFWPQVKKLLQQLWKNRVMRVILILLCVLSGALLLWAFVLCGKVSHGMRQPESRAETVIVLGCQVRDGQPSRLLRHRIDAAAEYLDAHPQAVCIVSGGQGANEDMTEASCMQRELIARGIAPERILVEDRSTTTQENLAFSRKLMEQNGLTGKVLIVSNKFHIYRALLLAKAQGLDADGLPASCEWYMLPPYVFREALALIYHCVFG